MIREDEFLNILKDCWTDREYRFKFPAGSAIIKILNDNGVDVQFSFQWLNNDGNKSGNTYSVDVMPKEELRKSITMAGYSRLK
jgi:hypothetical protein